MLFLEVSGISITTPRSRAKNDHFDDIIPVVNRALFECSWFHVEGVAEKNCIAFVLHFLHFQKRRPGNIATLSVHLLKSVLSPLHGQDEEVEVSFSDRASTLVFLRVPQACAYIPVFLRSDKYKVLVRP